MSLHPMTQRLALVAALASALPVQAADFNLSLTSDYRYRGISQSGLKPALQGGVDAALDGGFYVGAWGSTIKWIKDAGTIFETPAGNTKVEVDLYGGYKTEIASGLTLDVGGLYYLYPSNKLKNIEGLKNANTFEIYGALSYGPATLKYSHALTNTFGNWDSKNSYYLDLSASFDLGGGLMLAPHVGYQKIKGPYADAASYTDYSLTLSKEVSKGVTLSLAAVGTDADKAWYIRPDGKFLGKTAAVASVKFVF